MPTNPIWMALAAAYRAVLATGVFLHRDKEEDRERRRKAIEEYGRVDNLRKLCSDIFGEENLLAQIIWQKIHGTKNDANLKILSSISSPDPAQPDMPSWHKTALMVATDDMFLSNSPNRSIRQTRTKRYLRISVTRMEKCRSA
jgi:hypothetical protein